MITKYTSGTPIRTDAVVKDFAGIDINKFPVDYKIIDGKFIFSFDAPDSRTIPDLTSNRDYSIFCSYPNTHRA